MPHVQDGTNRESASSRGGWRSIGVFHLARPESLYLVPVPPLALSSMADEAVRVELPAGAWEVAFWAIPSDGRVYDMRVAAQGSPGVHWNVDDVVVSPVDDGLRLLGWVDVDEHVPGPKGVALVRGSAVDAFPAVPEPHDVGELAAYWDETDRIVSSFRRSLGSDPLLVPGAWTSASAAGRFPVVARVRDGAVQEARVSILPARVP